MMMTAPSVSTSTTTTDADDIKNSILSSSNSSSNSNNDERELYNDLKSFLQSPRPDLRIAATQAVVKTIQSDVAAAAARSGGASLEEESGSSSGSSNNMAKLVRYGLILPLVQNISYDNTTNSNDDDDDDEKKKSKNNNSSMDQVVSVNALKALVYLSSHGTSANQCIQDLLDHKCISRLVEIVLPSKNITVCPESDSSSSSNNETLLFARARINYALALMANLTRSEQGAVELVGKTLPEHAVPIHASSKSSKSSKDQRSAADDLDDDMPRVKPGMEILTARFLNPAFIQPNVDYKQLMARAAKEEEAEDDDENDNKNNNNNNNNKTPPCSASVAAAAAAALDSSTVDPYQHFAAVLMNVTQVEQGRNFLLQLHYNNNDKKNDNKNNNHNKKKHENNDVNAKQQDGEGTTVFQRLILLIKTSPNPIRRRGLAGLMRNVCLDKDSGWWLLHVVQIPRYILYPLAGPEALELHEKQGLDVDLWLSRPDKEREPDRDTRLFLVEALLLLCASGRVSRRRLRVRDKVPVILKWAEMVEEDEYVSERMNDCIQYLQRDAAEGDEDEDGTEEDEDADEEEEEEDQECEEEEGGVGGTEQLDENSGTSDERVANAYRRQFNGATSCPIVTTSAKGMTTTTATIKQQQCDDHGGAGDDFDNVD